MNIQDFSFNIANIASKARFVCPALILFLSACAHTPPAPTATPNAAAVATPTPATSKEPEKTPRKLGPAKLVDKVEAIVNKKAIYHSDIEKFRKLVPLRTKVDIIFANDPLAKKAYVSDNEIVNFLVDEAIIVDKFSVADTEVEQEITSIQGNLHIDREALKAAIAREGFSFDDYFKLMRVSLSKRQLIDREIRNKATVSDDDLKAEYNRTNMGSKTFRGAFHVYLIKIPKKNYKTQKLAKEEADKTYQALKSKKTFEEVAKELGDDTGGDLGYLVFSEMSPTLQKEIKKLNPESISPVFEDKNDYMIAKVADIKADVDEGFEKAKESLRGNLMEKEFAHQIRLWLDRQRHLNFVKINTKKE